MGEDQDSGFRSRKGRFQVSGFRCQGLSEDSGFRSENEGHGLSAFCFLLSADCLPFTPPRVANCHEQDKELSQDPACSFSPCASIRGAVLSCRSTRGKHGRRTDRPSTRHPGSSHSPNRRAWTAAWLGDFRAYPANLQKGPPGPTGVVVSGSPPAGAPRLDKGSMGSIREQSPGQVL